MRCFLSLLTAALLLNVASLRAQNPDSNAATEKAMKAAVAKAAPSVVMIETSGGQDLILGAGIRKVVGPTTGLLVDASGLVVTSTFNFVNKPTDIFVTIPGKGRFVAKVIGNDQTRMFTILKPQSEKPLADLPVPVAVPKKDIAIGQWSLALGRTLDPSTERLPSMSAGIISALGRVWGKAVQTDAKVSPVNYGGPLLAIDGRVQGILVPASPQGQDEKAGVEWYDSGIGFAIPLEDIFAVLPKLKVGTPEKPVLLRQGLLGITPKGADMYALPPIIGAINPDSAAANAGMLPDDLIIEIDGKPVVNFAQVQHALKPKYDGDTISAKIKRADKEISFDKLTLRGTQTEFQRGYLGILPMRDDPDAGVEIRFVFEKSPAEKVGLKVGDRIMKLAPKGIPQLRAFSGRDQFSGLMNTLTPGTEISLEVKRKEGGKTETLTVKLVEIPDEVPEKLPDADIASLKRAKETPKPIGPDPKIIPKKLEPKKEEPKKDVEPKKEEPKKEEKEAERGLIRRKIDVANRSYWMYVPRGYDPNVSWGIVLWLHPAGVEGRDADDMTDLWASYLRDYRLIMVAPTSRNKTGWVAAESGDVIDTLRDVLNEYTIDRQRIVAHGSGVGGQMAYFLGFNNRDLIRGVAPHAAALGNQPKDNLPNQKLSFYIVAGAKDPAVEAIKGAKPLLKEKKFPVFERIYPTYGKQYLDDDTLPELLRWIDIMDRQ